MIGTSDITAENNLLTMVNDEWRSVISNRALPQTGKFYFEVKCIDILRVFKG